MSKNQWQTILAGEGGQGLVFIGALLGEAAIADGKEAAQTASYTIASRGGFTKAEVVISDLEISFPAVTNPDVILTLSEEARAKYWDSLPSGAVLLYDSSLSGTEGDSKRVGLPFGETVKQAAAEGRKSPLNLVALGAVVGLTGMVGWDAFRRALDKRFAASGLAQANWDALQAGAVLVKDRGLKMS